MCGLTNEQVVKSCKVCHWTLIAAACCCWEVAQACGDILGVTSATCHWSQDGKFIMSHNSGEPDSCCSDTPALNPMLPAAVTEPTGGVVLPLLSNLKTEWVNFLERKYGLTSEPTESSTWFVSLIHCMQLENCVFILLVLPRKCSP